MKKIVFLLLMPFAIMAQVGTSEYEIKGLLKGLANNTTVFLINGINGQTIATASAQNGQFTLKGKLTHPELVQIGLQAEKMYWICLSVMMPLHLMVKWQN